MEHVVEENCSWIDWKATVGDAECALRHCFPAYESVFERATFRQLVENYSTTDADTFLPALGQELSGDDLVLYQVDSGDDGYALYLCRKDESDAFEQRMKAENIPLSALKQPHKKWGTPAKRLDWGQRLPYQCHNVYDILLDFTYPYTFAHSVDEIYDGYYPSGRYYTFLDLTVFPPKEEEIEMQYTPAYLWGHDYSDEHGLYCAEFIHLVQEKRKRHKQTVIKVGADPLNFRAWEEISVPETIKSVLVDWIGDDILLRGNEGKSGWIPNAAKGGRICYPFELPYEKQPSALIRMADGKTYLANDRYVFAAEYGGDVLPEWKIITESDDPIGGSDCVSLEPNRFFYVTAQGFRDSPIISEFDILAGKVIRTFRPERMDHQTRLQKLDNEWLVVYRIGDGEKEYDMAQFWNMKSGERIAMPFGRLGKYILSKVLPHPDGSTLLYVNDADFNGYILRVENMLERLRAMQ
ncbi:hypothetical protein [Glaesserella sp.]|uniref:hypothetical protein n=1 Tax=Glaesserella sp. TaxID=2094731 RepID=UPI00359FB80F